MILVIFGILYFYFYRYVYLNNQYFKNNQINTKIIRVYNYENKSLLYYYDNKHSFSIYETKGDTLKFGDSISKKGNTLNFKIYRKDFSGNYQFYKSYDSDNY